MIKKIRKFLETTAAFLILGGLLMSIFGLKEVYQRWNVNTEPQEMTLENVALIDEQVSFISIQGGTPDLDNTYEYQSRSKRGAKLGNPDVYVPMLSKSGEYRFTLKLKGDENFNQNLTVASFNGLLEPGTELPIDLQIQYEDLFPDDIHYVLDTNYQAGDENTSLKTLFVFLGIMFLGIIIQVLLSKTAPQRQNEEEVIS